MGAAGDVPSLALAERLTATLSPFHTKSCRSPKLRRALPPICSVKFSTSFEGSACTEYVNDGRVALPGKKAREIAEAWLKKFRNSGRTLILAPAFRAAGGPGTSRSWRLF